MISIGVGAAGVAIDREVVVPALLGLAIIVAMWWTYFDVSAFAGEHRLTSVSGADRAKLARDAYSYLHLPMIIAAICFSLGVKKTLVHTNDVLDPVPAAALCGGLVLYLVGRAAFRMRCGGSLAWPRVLAALVLILLGGVSGLIDALTLLSAVTITFVALVAYETVAKRESRRQVRSGEEPSWI